jgi:hypothetical protein
VRSAGGTLIFFAIMTFGAIPPSFAALSEAAILILGAIALTGRPQIVTPGAIAPCGAARTGGLSAPPTPGASVKNQ